MATTEIEICNAALGHCLQPAIMSLDQQSPGASYCNTFYPMARDSVLRKFDWPCARVFIDGVAMTWAANAAWSYAYAYPPSVAAIRTILPAFHGGPRITFQIGKLPEPSMQRVIFTNASPAVIVATEAIENPMLFEPLLADVIALDLATRIVLPMTKKRDLFAQISQSRQLAFNEAITVSFNEERYDGDKEAPWTAVR